MGKQSDAKRKAKLKERRKQRESAVARANGVPDKVAQFFASYDVEPNVIAELFNEDHEVMVHIEGDVREHWTVIVGGEPVAGTDDEYVALGMFLLAAVDDQDAGGKPYMRFSPWLLDAISARCDAGGIDETDFLMSLLPPEKRHLALPQTRVS